MTLLNQIESYIGTFADTVSLDNWLTQGAKNIINMLPDDKLKNYTAELSITGAGMSMSGYRVYRVHSNGYGSIEYPIDMRARLQDSNSLYYATSTYPAHIFDKGLLFIFPAGGTVLVMQFPTVGNTDSSISNFPPELIQAVILYTCIQATMQNINTVKSSLSSLIIPVSPAAPSFSYSVQTDTIDLTTDLATLATYIDTSNDIELAQGKIGEIQEKIRQFVEQTQFAISQAKETTDVSVQQYSALLQKYSGDLNSFSQQLGQLGGEFQQLTGLLKLLQDEYSLILKSNGLMQ